MNTPFIAALLLSATAAIAGEAWTPRPGLSVLPEGRILAGGLPLALEHFDGAWHSSQADKAVAGAGRLADGVWRREGAWAAAGPAARLTQSLRTDGDGLRLEATLAEAGETKSFHLALTLPGDPYRGGELRIDGQALALPAESPQPQVRATAPARRVAVPLASGGTLEISGDLRVMVQDNRTWKSDTFSLRVVAGADRSLAATLRLLPPPRPAVIEPLPLGEAGARPRRDGIAGDGAGGWTDQGDNDLRSLPAGRLVAGGFPFLVGDGAVVLTRTRVAGVPATAAIPVADGRHGACLYLLHALAWSPRDQTVAGRVRLQFADGGSEVREIAAKREVADWWNPAERLPNAVLGWSGDNPHAAVGLYATRLAIPDRPLARVELEVATDTVWMVAAMSLGEEAPYPVQVPDVIAEGPRWRPVAVPWEVEPGSALDLGAMTAMPVPGRLVMRGSHFELEDRPGTPVRLLGANLCFTANYPEKPLAERMAAGLRRMGHNSIRIHHFDGALVRPGGDGTELDPAKIDLLDWLFACCKREGLWITTDIYVSRRLPKGAIPELAGYETKGYALKALAPLLPSALENWKRFATNFVTHRNPYTGLTWGEDPALVTLSLINEDNLISAWNDEPPIRALYEERFAAVIAQRPEAERSGPAREAAFRGWLRDLQSAACDAMRAHLRSLGVRAPTTSANMASDWWTISVRDGFDFVDNHAYHDHPSFPVLQWRLPYGYHQRAPVSDLLRVPAGLAQSRRLDRPFTVTELNYCLPNHRRADYAAGAAAVAALQDWDGIWRFAFSHDIRNVAEEKPAAGFDLVGDPIALLGERAMALLYRRGDIAPAPWAAAMVYDPATAARSRGGPHSSISQLALHARVGNLPAASAQTATVAGLRCLLDSEEGGRSPAGRLPVLAADAKLPEALAAAGLVPAGDLAASTVRSAGGQVAIDGKAGMLTVDGRRSVAAVLPGGATATLGGVAIANHDPEAATVVVAALDDAELAASKRVLVLHLTDALNTGMRFASRRHNLVETWGGSPVLVRAGAIAVRLPGARAGRAFALDLAGKRREETALVPDAGGQRLDAAVVRAWGASLAWEIVRE